MQDTRPFAPKKCVFGILSRKLLGFIESKKGIEVDPNKVKDYKISSSYNVYRERFKL